MDNRVSTPDLIAEARATLRGAAPPVAETALATPPKVVARATTVQPAERLRNAWRGLPSTSAPASTEQQRQRAVQHERSIQLKQQLTLAAARYARDLDDDPVAQRLAEAERQVDAMSAEFRRREAAHRAATEKLALNHPHSNAGSLAASPLPSSPSPSTPPSTPPATPPPAASPLRQRLLLGDGDDDDARQPQPPVGVAAALHSMHARLARLEADQIELRSDTADRQAQIDLFIAGVRRQVEEQQLTQRAIEARLGALEAVPSAAQDEPPHSAVAALATDSHLLHAALVERVAALEAPSKARTDLRRALRETVRGPVATHARQLEAMREQLSQQSSSLSQQQAWNRSSATQSTELHTASRAVAVEFEQKLVALRQAQKAGAAAIDELRSEAAAARAAAATASAVPSTLAVDLKAERKAHARLTLAHGDMAARLAAVEKRDHGVVLAALQSAADTRDEAATASAAKVRRVAEEVEHALSTTEAAAAAIAQLGAQLADTRREAAAQAAAAREQAVALGIALERTSVRVEGAARTELRERTAALEESVAEQLDAIRSSIVASGVPSKNDAHVGALTKEVGRLTALTSALRDSVDLEAAEGDSSVDVDVLSDLQEQLAALRSAAAEETKHSRTELVAMSATLARLQSQSPHLRIASRVAGNGDDDGSLAVPPSWDGASALRAQAAKLDAVESALEALCVAGVEQADESRARLGSIELTATSSWRTASALDAKLEQALLMRSDLKSSVASLTDQVATLTAAEATRSGSRVVSVAASDKISLAMPAMAAEPASTAKLGELTALAEGNSVRIAKLISAFQKSKTWHKQAAEERNELRLHLEASAKHSAPSGSGNGGGGGGGWRLGFGLFESPSSNADSAGGSPAASSSRAVSRTTVDRDEAAAAVAASNKQFSLYEERIQRLSEELRACMSSATESYVAQEKVNEELRVSASALERAINERFDRLSTDVATSHTTLSRRSDGNEIEQQTRITQDELCEVKGQLELLATQFRTVEASADRAAAAAAEDNALHQDIVVQRERTHSALDAIRTSHGELAAHVRGVLGDASAFVRVSALQTIKVELAAQQEHLLTAIAVKDEEQKLKADVWRASVLQRCSADLLRCVPAASLSFHNCCFCVPLLSSPRTLTPPLPPPAID